MSGGFTIEQIYNGIRYCIRMGYEFPSKYRDPLHDVRWSEFKRIKYDLDEDFQGVPP